ncbi:OmpA family protein [Sphingomonas jatrophae]|uniref:Outer membrane protein OmpA n=1 Tax=Sphingomonas jatrophae TaxID=1166337 RepID=A0A1I6JYW2_9SPHN|nr:OmpA family protein [Sphingomonas jatrophae]SFR84144.1 Outer membrane protein OmpA [Sphingomonas jatrophae]
MTRMFTLALSGALLATPALAADPKPSRSASEIVCALTGDCAAASDGPRAQRPAEAAFSFTRPGGAKPTPPAKAASVRTATVAEPARMRRAAAPAAASSGLDMRINFASGSADLTPQARAEAAQFAKAMAMPQLAGRRFVVEGHTDSVGNRDYNLDLSKRRAASVVSYIVSLGVPADRVEAKGYGFDKPLPGRGAGAPGNRRVQFVPAA